MARKRVSGTERKTLILDAARLVFARYGYDGAKTLQIAREAKVSEALVYRHFPSKLALYRAVLRQIFREQDESWQALGMRAPGAEGIVQSLKSYFNAVIVEPEGQMQIGFRMTLASLAGDGHFASLIYRRSQRRNLRAIVAAQEEARQAGDIVGEKLDIGDTSMFTEHVGTMLNAMRALAEASRPYHRDGTSLVRDAVWFCSRGIGMTDAAIARYIDD
jgi:AcrR family transcriptional regulator